jgi:NAD(P)-dependent dehydrogenase (short-subunit alcohol dehydrogenase family)
MRNSCSWPGGITKGSSSEAVYFATKGRVILFTKATVQQMARRQVTANCVCLARPTPRCSPRSACRPVRAPHDAALAQPSRHPIQRLTLVYVPDDELLELAAGYARGWSLYSVGSSMFKLDGWAAATGALNLDTGEVEPPGLSPVDHPERATN